MQRNYDLIRKKRIDLNLTQEYLADQIGISARTLSRIENSKRFLKVTELKGICKVIGMDPNNLLSNNEKHNFSNNKIIYHHNHYTENERELYQKLLKEKDIVIELLRSKGS